MINTLNKTTYVIKLSLARGSRRISVNHGGKIWQQETSMEAGVKVIALILTRKHEAEKTRSIWWVPVRMIDAFICLSIWFQPVELFGKDEEM